VSKNWKEIYKLETELQELKMKKHIYIFKLKELYINLMKNPQDAIGNDKTLFTLISAMRRIKEEVKDSFYPEILDKEG
jgi:hypothetical protein